MLKRTVLWASHFIGTLTAALISNTQGQNITVGPDGEQQFLPPNPSAMWPPHRPHPTQKRHSRKSRHYPTTSIRQAMKRGGQNIRIANPEKYLHASRTA